VRRLPDLVGELGQQHLHVRDRAAGDSEAPVAEDDGGEGGYLMSNQHLRLFVETSNLNKPSSVEIFMNGRAVVQMPAEESVVEALAKPLWEFMRACLEEEEPCS
jgi:hypothetical protein